MASQDTREHGVECAHPHIPGCIADKRIDTLAHLIGSLICEGDRQDIGRIDPAHTDQVRDTVSNHARLSRTGSGEDQEGAFIMKNCLFLFSFSSKSSIRASRPYLR